MNLKLTKLVKDRGAVSPVIGVILMVAITVILAAVIGTFVLGLGGNTQSAPQASIEMVDAGGSVDAVSDGSNADLIELNHKGSDTIAQDETTIQVDGPSNSADIWTGSAVTLVSNGDYDVSLIVDSGSTTEFGTADTMTIVARTTDNDGVGATIDLAGDYTITIIDDPSGQIIADSTVEVS